MSGCSQGASSWRSMGAWLRRLAIEASMTGAMEITELARAGRLGEARLGFEKMLTHANHVGLYAGQIGRAGQQQGNFPRR